MYEGFISKALPCESFSLQYDSKSDLPIYEKKIYLAAVHQCFTRIFLRDSEPQSNQSLTLKSSTQLHNAFSKDSIRAARNQRFANALKRIMDLRFQPEWHVIFGESMGYALKYRRRSLGLCKIAAGDGSFNFVAVTYKSPGYEIVDSQIPVATCGTPVGIYESSDFASLQNQIDSDALEKKIKTSIKEVNLTTSNSCRDLEIIYPHHEESPVNRMLHSHQILNVVSQCLLQHAASDKQLFATTIRSSLTSAVGPMWHVVAGADFAVSESTFCRNTVIGIGSIRVLCFQHSQSESSMNKRLISILSLAIVSALACIMLMKDKFCGMSWTLGETIASRFVSKMQTRLCQNNGSNWGLYITLVALLMSIGIKLVSRSR